MATIDKQTLNNIIDLMCEFDVTERQLTIIYVDVKSIDDKWRETDPDNYISDNIQSDKYNNSRRDLLNNKVFAPTYMSYEDDTIFVWDGRHRFANLRDMGAIVVPIMIDIDEYDYFKKYERMIDVDNNIYEE
jgi:hypothetical protein